MEQHTETDIRPPRWSALATSRSMATAVGVTGALLLAGIGVAAAQTDGAPAPTNPPAEEGARATRAAAGPGKMRGGPGGPGGPGAHKGMRGAVHGEFVTRHGDGFRTMATQTGTVTAVSQTSITVKSADDYTKTYVVDASTMVNAGRDGIDSVKQGHTVDIHAVVDGDTYRAMRINDITTNTAIRKHWNPNAPEPSAEG